MPKIRIGCDSAYPSYDVCDSGEEVEVTDEELEWIKIREKHSAELQEFLGSKFAEAQEEQLENQRARQEERLQFRYRRRGKDA